MSTNDLERLLPCPFCGGRMAEFQNNGQVWQGTKYSAPLSVSVRHWCKGLPGPIRMIERIGRDKEQAIECWNMRAQPAPSVPDEWHEFLKDLTLRISEAGDHTHESFHREMVRLAHRAHQMLRLPQSAQTAPSVPDGWIDPNDKTQTRYLPHIGEPVLFSHKGRVYYGKHTGGSFTAGAGVCAQHFVTWDCMWRPIPAAPAAPGAQENKDAE